MTASDVMSAANATLGRVTAPPLKTVRRQIEAVESSPFIRSGTAKSVENLVGSSRSMMASGAEALQRLHSAEFCGHLSNDVLIWESSVLIFPLGIE
jgi:hypothetical protein